MVENNVETKFSEDNVLSVIFLCNVFEDFLNSNKRKQELMQIRSVEMAPTQPSDFPSLFSTSLFSIGSDKQPSRKVMRSL